MRIVVLGYTDKRPVLYSLLKVLQSTGDVALITDDRHFQRLIESSSPVGHLLNIFICVTSVSPDEVWAEVGYSPEDFDHVVYDVHGVLPENADKFMHVCGSQLDEGEAELLECIEQYTKVKLMYDGKELKEKGSYNLPVTLNVISNTELIENKKILNPYSDRKFRSVMAKAFKDIVGLSERSILNLLGRGWKG
jgi:hypothetical protein